MPDIGETQRNPDLELGHTRPARPAQGAQPYGRSNPRAQRLGSSGRTNANSSVSRQQSQSRTLESMMDSSLTPSCHQIASTRLFMRVYGTSPVVLCCPLAASWPGRLSSSS